MKGIGKTQAVLYPRISAPCLITNLEYVELPNLHFFYTWRASLKIGRHSPYVLGILRQVYISPTNWNSILGALGSRSGSKKGLRRKESLILESCCISFHRESTPVSQRSSTIPMLLHCTPTVKVTVKIQGLGLPIPLLWSRRDLQETYVISLSIVL